MKTTSIHDQIIDYYDKKYPDMEFSPRDMFYNPSKKGLRLTQFGFQLLKEDFDATRFPVDDETHVAVKHILALDRNMVWPYYLTKHSIFLFGEEDAVIFKLVGSFSAWIDSLG